MKNLSLVLSAALLLVITSGVWAQAGGPGSVDQPQQQVQQQDRDCLVCGTCDGDQEQICQRIKLTDEQKEQIKGLLEDYAAKIKAAKRIMVKMQLQEELKQKIKALLTEEQVQCIAQLHLRKRLMDRVKGYKLYMFNKLELTDDQKEALAAIKLEFRDAMAAATSREEIKAAFEEMKEAILLVLTEEQIQQLEQMRQIKDHCPCDGQVSLFDCASKLELTEEQIAQLQQLREHVQQMLDDSETCAVKARILDRTRDRILDILTQEQRAQLRQILRDGTCKDTDTTDPGTES